MASLSELVSLARQLVSFDPELAEELADQLRARAQELTGSAAAMTQLEARDRARRFNTLAELIEKEKAVRSLHRAEDERH